jgi:hypothetical protein
VRGGLEHACAHAAEGASKLAKQVSLSTCKCADSV